MVEIAAGSLDNVPPIPDFRRCIKRVESPTPLASIKTIQNPRILVVDDGDVNRTLIKLVLGRSGAQVEEAENGQEAVQLATDKPFDLILMDMQMPILDGYSATEELRKRGLNIPIIAMTANAMKGDDLRCREAGCSGYVSKPVDHDTLIATVFGALIESKGYFPIAVNTPSGQAAPSPTLSINGGGKLISMLPMDDADFRDIVLQFIVRLAEKLIEMRTALATKDLSELAMLAHWLKGTGGGSGFPILTETAVQLEHFAKEGRFEEAEATVSRIEQIVPTIALE